MKREYSYQTLKKEFATTQKKRNHDNTRARLKQMNLIIYLIEFKYKRRKRENSLPVNPTNCQVLIFFYLKEYTI